MATKRKAKPVDPMETPDGCRIVGTMDLISGTARVLGFDEDGEPEWEGETEVNWDGQESVTCQGLTVYEDDQGGEWIRVNGQWKPARFHDSDLPARRLSAIVARINGVWDDPELVKWGPMGDMRDDLLRIATAEYPEAEG